MSEKGTKTNALELAERYIELGGKRRAVLDDNIVSTREWDKDLPEAETFWNDQIASLDEDARAEVSTHLPSINER